MCQLGPPPDKSLVIPTICKCNTSPRTMVFRYFLSSFPLDMGFRWQPEKKPQPVAPGISLRSCQNRELSFIYNCTGKCEERGAWLYVWKITGNPWNTVARKNQIDWENPKQTLTRCGREALRMYRVPQARVLSMSWVHSQVRSWGTEVRTAFRPARQCSPTPLCGNTFTLVLLSFA